MQHEHTYYTMTDEFRSILRSFANTGDSESVKPALRQYIDMLEGLYKNL